MTTKHVFSNRIIALAAISVASFLLAGLFFYQAHAQPLAAQFKSGKVADASRSYGRPSSAKGTAGTSETSADEVPIREIHVANSGLMLLRGARVISISGSTIRVGMAWGPNIFSWKLNINYNTKFLTNKGEKETMADIQTGDIITVDGMLTEGGIEPSIEAQFVRR